MAKTVEEIDNADKQGVLSQPISYKETTSSLPYLAAVVKEAMRLHPSVGFLMERHTPPQGATICGQHIPGGTIVGINPWVTGRNEDIFPDPEAFRPERWLESSEGQLREMENLLSLNFGAGSRTCLGKHISLIEIHKVIPQLLRTFKVELTHPGKEWEICNHWFVQQDGLICTLSRR
jgi:cytochrome P450